MGTTGFRGSPHTFIARLKIPCRITRYFATLRFDSDRESVSFHRSSISGVTSSIATSPSSRAILSAVCRYSVSVDGLHARSCSQYRSHSAAASDSVAPVQHHSRQRLGPRFVHHLSEPSLSRALRVVARRRTTALGPGRTQLRLHLPPGRQSIFRAPRRPARAFDPEDTPGNLLHRHQTLRLLGTYSGHVCELAFPCSDPPSAKQPNPCKTGPRRGEGIEPSKPGAARPCRF